jgi:type I restriction enzyme S subunit
MELKPGYKQTEVGVIPEEWDVRTLASVAEKIMVGIASAATHAYRTKGIPLLRNQNIRAGYLDDSDILFVDYEYEKTFRNKRLRTGDLLTARTGYPGMTCVVPRTYDSAQSFTTLITRPTAGEVESAFLCSFINSAQGQRFFEQSQIGGAQKNVNAGTLRKMPVPVPHPSEQRAIARALSDVDALLGGLDRLIAKKRDLKQATMQQLLTGQTRFPGFDGEWEKRTLGQLFDFSGGYSASREQLSSKGHCYLHYGDIHKSSKSFVDVGVEYPDIPKLDIPLKKVSPTSLLEDGDVVFVDASEDDEGTSRHVVVVNKASVPFIAGLHTIVAKPKSK